jgi:hypothetical protein
MQLSTDPALRPLIASLLAEGAGEAQRDPRYAEYKVIRRNGAVVGFQPSKISVAVTKAFLAVNGGTGAASAVFASWWRADRSSSRRADARQPLAAPSILRTSKTR